MTDSLMVKGSSFYAAATNSSSYNGQETIKSNLVNAPVMVFSPNILDLKESLEWLLGSESDATLPHEERIAKRERRVDLLLWLLNLEPRLGPYGDPQPG